MIDSIGGEWISYVSLSIEPLELRCDLSKASKEGNLETKVHVLNVDSE